MKPTDIKRILRMGRARQSTNKSDFLSTGVTVLDLACSGRLLGGILKGHLYVWSGDSTSGKTMGLLTILAEACLNKNFSKHRIIYDDVEHGALMDFGRYFAVLQKRIEKPSKAGSSSTIEEFYTNITDAMDKGPCIYVLDSMDALDAEADVKKFNAAKRARAKGTDEAGTYGTAKAKTNSTHLRMVVNQLKKTGSILFIVTQTRDNLGFGFDKKTRGGGRALRFYATLEFWTSIKEKMKKRVKGKERSIGVITQLAVKKNRMQGKERTVFIPIYHSSGVDDLGASIMFLITEGHWKTKDNKKTTKVSSKTVTAPEFEYSGTVEGLIKRIQDEEAEQELRLLVKKVWREIEDECTVERKNRYALD